MDRWTEVRGYTLRLSDGTPTVRFVRVSLCSRRGLFGLAYNVREARAETDADSRAASPADLGLGRLLSWRWRDESTADGLLIARIRTLQSLGYAVVESQQHSRGPWDWLADLVSRQLVEDSTDESARTHDPGRTHSRGRTRGLKEALSPLDLDPKTILEGLAAVLHLSEADLGAPNPAALRRADPNVLGTLLPFLIAHDDGALREIGLRWIRLPATAYELDPDLVLEWLRGDTALCRELVERLPREGLALLGAGGLGTLANRARSPRAKHHARAWISRLEMVEDQPIA